MKPSRYYLPIAIAVLATLPGIFLRVSGAWKHILEAQPADPLQVAMVALFAGIAVLGASFLLLWACDAAQMDISRTLALAVVALIAVLPEYAVDMYFTWQAAGNPAKYAPLAIANMTGANRLLIGVAWTAIAAIFWFKTRKSVKLENERRTEVFFLGLATLYALVIPIKGSLAWYDGIVFIGIYIWYMTVAGRRPTEECEVEGPAELLVALPKLQRRLTTIAMLLFAAGAILACAEPFSEGLIGTGQVFKINEFLLVQWLAPIASEAPEFLVAIMFAIRGHAGMALGSLLSSKLNQWTLLVGMIPGVYAIASGTLGHPIPMNTYQMHEIMLTAAQSLLAMVIIVTLELTIGQAILLFVLFAGQLFLPEVVRNFLVHAPPGFFTAMPAGLGARELWAEHIESLVHPFFTVLYFLSALYFIIRRPGRFKNIWLGARATSCALPQPESGPVIAPDREKVS